jgi:hypothetical protein
VRSLIKQKDEEYDLLRRNHNELVNLIAGLRNEER